VRARTRAGNCPLLIKQQTHNAIVAREEKGGKKGRGSSGNLVVKSRVTMAMCALFRVLTMPGAQEEDFTVVIK